MNAVRTAPLQAVASPYARPAVAPTPSSAPAPPFDEAAIGAETVEAPPSVAHTVGTGLLLALSLAGVAASAAPALAAEPQQPISQSLPYDPTAFKGGSAAQPVTAEKQTAILEDLSARGELRTSRDDTDGDDYGRKVTAEEALERLQHGEAIVVRARIGAPDAFRQPFPINEGDVAWHVRYEGVRVASLQELDRLNAAERLTSQYTAGTLTPEEQHVVNELRMFEGGVPGGQVRQFWEFQPGYPGYPGYPGRTEPVWQFSPDAPQPAIYSQARKGGLFGIGTHADRVTAYEGLQELQAGRSLTIRTARGETVQVDNAEQLKRVYSDNLEH